MTQLTRLGFLGAGQMASALARGLVAGGRISSQQIVASDPYPASRDAFQSVAPEAMCLDDNLRLVDSAETIVLAVKPQHVAQVADQVAGRLAGKLLISIVAGTSLEQLAERFGTQRLIRVMPNAPCLVGFGAAGMAVGPD